jgi:peptidoglycan/LPS O-acetylase OafA/YrhL
VWPVAERLASWILLPWVVLGFGLAYSERMMLLVRSGDYSYGVYIYAFPIQQTIVHLFPGISHPTFLACSLAATFVAAALSWHLVEKPALQLKPRRTAAG